MTIPPHIPGDEPPPNDHGGKDDANADAQGPRRGRRTQQQRRDQTRGAIIEAARKAFLEHGYAAVPLEQIVTRAGLTRGALYHQFTDKAAVLEAVINAEAQVLQEKIRPGLVAVDHPLERIRLGFSLYLDAIDDIRILRLIHVDYPAHCGPARAILSSPWLSYVEGLVADAMSKGLMRQVDVRTISRLILAFYRESLVAIAYSDNQAATRRDMAAALDALMEGLRTDRR